MKSFLAITALTLFACNAYATPLVIKSLPEKEASVEAARVVEAKVLGKNESQDINVRLLTVDNGKSTDLSPRYRLLLTYFHAGEMNNARTSFELGSFYEVKSTKRIAPGIYQVAVKQLADQGGFVTLKLTIDTTQVFIDDRNLVLKDFDDPYFESTIKIEQSN